MNDLAQRLRAHDIQPTLQRLAVAECVLDSDSHPSAEEVLSRVRRKHPTLSRATVYNTLNLFAQRGLLRTENIRDDSVVFDPKIERHHHFVDDATGRIYDVPWEALRVTGEKNLAGFAVREYQVVLRGRRKRRS
jgi:Fur family transcriptional regulator, iron response regulator